MSRHSIGSVFSRYAVAWLYLLGFCATVIIYSHLPGRDKAAFLGWASTSVHNLEHHPVGCLAVSAFIATGFVSVWPFLIALAMFGANHLLGNWRTFITCAAGHIIGTLVSEGVVAYRVAHGTLPQADRYLVDVGPSYVVVAAISVGLLWGTWLIRAAAALDFTLLIFVGHIFEGLSHVSVAPVGHLTALITGAAAGSFFIWQRQGKARTCRGHTSAS